MFKVAIYRNLGIISVIEIDESCIMNFIEKIPNEYRIQIISYKEIGV